LSLNWNRERSRPQKIMCQSHKKMKMLQRTPISTAVWHPNGNGFLWRVLGLGREDMGQPTSAGVFSTVM